MGSQNWGADHSTHALKKDCNWLPFVTFKLDVDPIQEKEMTRLRHRNNIDELLRTQSRFLQINDNEVCFAEELLKWVTPKLQRRCSMQRSF